MRYPAAEKLEIIQLVEQSHLPVRRSLEQIGIPRSTFYRWCDLYQTGGPEALDDCSPRPDRVWNRIPDDVRARIVTLALDEPELSPRELAVRFTDAERYFEALARKLRIDPEFLKSSQGVEILAGNAIAPGSEPIALAYAGHQFGHPDFARRHLLF